ncbi:MAG: PDZ domain-containing protein [Calothrix sp. FI2-JRJ7]|jgi:membrane-associated protease RseP (regulator of RpoE activity)|nr:PDZ domain-containing protein [Calothrix sp. FI2-JRJ7]
MTLWSSAKGLVLVGNNPIDVKTNTSSPTYAPDNFLIATRPDNSVVLRNYSLSGANKSLTESPVERKFLGYPSIGINMVELTPEKRSEINRKNNLPLITRDSGVLVVSVNANSTASRSGVKPGDVIVSINENNVSNVKQVQNAIQSSGLDSVLKFNLDRGGRVWL